MLVELTNNPRPDIGLKPGMLNACDFPFQISAALQVLVETAGFVGIEKVFYAMAHELIRH